MVVKDACRAGDAETCRKIKLKDAGVLSGGLIGGALAGMASASLAVASMCVGLSIAFGRSMELGCAVVIVGVGAFVVGDVSGEDGDVI